MGVEVAAHHRPSIIELAESVIRGLKYPFGERTLSRITQHVDRYGRNSDGNLSAHGALWGVPRCLCSPRVIAHASTGHRVRATFFHRALIDGVVELVDWAFDEVDYVFINTNVQLTKVVNSVVLTSLSRLLTNTYGFRDFKPTWSRSHLFSWCIHRTAHTVYLSW